MTFPMDAGTIKRFWSYVDKADGCWPWLGCHNDAGYGMLHVRDERDRRFRPRRAHRFSWCLVNGAIPSGMELDHLCRNRGCVNPEHLEAVSHRENVLRGVATSAKHAIQTHCKRGHIFADANLYITPGGARQCRTCRRDYDRRRRGSRLAA